MTTLQWPRELLQTMRPIVSPSGVAHADGRTLIGRLHETPEPGLFYVQRDPSRPGVVEGGFVEDLYPQDFAKIEVLRA